MGFCWVKFICCDASVHRGGSGVPMSNSYVVDIVFIEGNLCGCMVIRIVWLKSVYVICYVFMQVGYVCLCSLFCQFSMRIIH